MLKRHIVARIDQLMSLCDELEAGLMRSQADSEQLKRAAIASEVDLFLDMKIDDFEQEERRYSIQNT